MCPSIASALTVVDPSRVFHNIITPPTRVSIYAQAEIFTRACMLLLPPCRAHPALKCQSWCGDDDDDDDDICMAPADEQSVGRERAVLCLCAMNAITPSTSVLLGVCVGEYAQMHDIGMHVLTCVRDPVQPALRRVVVAFWLTTAHLHVSAVCLLRENVNTTSLRSCSVAVSMLDVLCSACTSPGFGYCGAVPVFDPGALKRVVCVTNSIWLNQHHSGMADQLS